jgi:hypothetical protein
MEDFVPQFPAGYFERDEESCENFEITIKSRIPIPPPKSRAVFHLKIGN